MKLADLSDLLAVDALHRTQEAIDGPLRAAVDELAAPLRLGAGFHFGFWDEAGNATPASPGKLIRPAFLLGAARAVSGEPVTAAAVRAGVAIELVHNFSLVHDDVMDADRVRRGRPTVWARFGVPHAILVGDARCWRSRVRCSCGTVMPARGRCVRS